MSKLIEESLQWISKAETKHYIYSAIVTFLIGSSGWKLWKHFGTSSQVKSKKERNELSTHSELIEYLENYKSIEFNDCMKFIFETVDRKKYATDQQLSNEDFQLLKPYADSAMPLRHNATISAPHMHLTCLHALNGSVTLENSKVDEISCLDIGSGSGFISAALCHLLEYHGKKGTVLAIDHISDLVELGRENVERDESSKKFLEESCPIRLIFQIGNGYEEESIRKLFIEHFSSETISNSENIPLFDLIHMGAASPVLPQHLYKLLKPNGRLVCPVGPSIGIQELLCIEKGVKVSKSNSFERSDVQLVQSIAKVHFVPLFGSTEEQERHFNRSNPRVVKVNDGEQVVVLPYLHLIDNSITCLEDIKWEGDEE